MKLQALTSMLAASALAVGTTIVLGYMAKAENTKFICGNYQNYPTTIAETSNGKVPVIRWTSDNYFEESGEDALSRCNRVSGLIENLYRNGQFDEDIIADTHNQHDIVCALNHRDDSCSLLFGAQSYENVESLRYSLIEKLEYLASARSFSPLER